MSLYNILLAIQYISIALMLSMCVYISKKWSKPAHGRLFFYTIVTLVNNAGYLALMQAQTEREAVLIWQIIYICRAWIPYALFIFVLDICSVKKRKTLANVLATVHVLTYVMVLTMRFNPLFYRSYTFVNSGLFPHLVFKYGIWHILYDCLILSYIIIGVRLLILSTIKEQKPRKKKQFLFVTLAVISICSFWMSGLPHIIPDYDMKTLGYTVGAIFFFIAIFYYDILDVKNVTEAVVEQKEEKKDNTPKIEGFGDHDSRVKISLNEVLYFEADAEQVFAYTNEEIYNIKMRLYQVEEISQVAGIIRVSKSHLVNVKMIQSVRPALNSRLYAKMPNGEEILVSRKYAPVLKNAIA